MKKEIPYCDLLSDFMIEKDTVESHFSHTCNYPETSRVALAKLYLKYWRLVGEV